MCSSSSPSSSILHCSFFFGLLALGAILLYQNYPKPPPPPPPPASNESDSKSDNSTDSSSSSSDFPIISSILSDLAKQRFQDALTKIDSELGKLDQNLSLASELYLLRARAENGLEHYSKVLEAARQSVSLKYSVQAKFLVGESLYFLGQWSEAIQELEESIKNPSISPEDREAAILFIKDAKVQIGNYDSGSENSSPKSSSNESKNENSQVDESTPHRSLSLSEASLAQSFFDSGKIREQESEASRLSLEQKVEQQKMIAQQHERWRNNNSESQIEESSADFLSAPVGNLDFDSFKNEIGETRENEIDQDSLSRSQQFDPDSHEDSHAGSEEGSIVMIERPSEKSIAEIENLEQKSKK